jgi:hypothetical protein
MRIVVAGLSAMFPLGGVFWDYFQYVQGFADLGHEVLYVEDTGIWYYDPSVGDYVQSGEHSAGWLERQISQCLPAQQNNWYLRDAAGVTYGAEASTVLEFCRTADLFLNVSGASAMSPDVFSRARAVYIDSDPMYTQVVIARAQQHSDDRALQQRLEIIDSHDVRLSFGENIGQDDCLVPAAPFDWLPTRQPVLINVLAPYRVPATERSRVLTTIGTWEPSTQPIMIEGRPYYGKRHEFLRFSRLPERSPLPFELAMPVDLSPPGIVEQGWGVTDPAVISASAESYLRYLGSSFAEWSVAKHAYVASRSGWFSGRTAVYLALGIPAIVQDTGFSRFLPTGEGLFAFSTPDEALAAIEEVAANYEWHCAAALEIAQEHFDARRVLTRLIDDVFSSSNAADVPSTTVRAS